MGRQSSHDGRRPDGYDASVRFRAALAAFALVAARVDGAPAPAVVAPGLAFALTLRGDGSVLASGPFSLNVPGGSGPLRIELARLSASGATLRGSVRARNGSGLLVAGLVLDLESASAAPKEASAGAGRSVPLRLREPVVFGDLLPGEETPPLAFEAGPLPLGDDVLLVTLLGAVAGLAVAPPVDRKSVV